MSEQITRPIHEAGEEICAQLCSRGALLHKHLHYQAGLARMK